MTAWTRLADAIESALWDRQDTRALARGWQVSRVGRWQRRYRDPRLTIALAARAAAAADTRGQDAPAARLDWTEAA